MDSRADDEPAAEGEAPVPTQAAAEAEAPSDGETGGENSSELAATPDGADGEVKIDVDESDADAEIAGAGPGPQSSETATATDSGDISAAVEDPDLDLTGGALLPRVEQMLTRITVSDEKNRWQRFFSAAGAAIERLGELDVSTAGGGQLGSDADGAAVLETVEPTARATLRRVSAFLALARRELNLEQVEEEGDLDFALGDEVAKTPAKTADAADETHKTLRAFCLNLAHELSALEKVLTHHDDSDAWGLLEKLGEFRGRARSGIGEMVFVSARQFAVVRKEDVVPFYKEDVDASLALRRAITNLRARVEYFQKRIGKIDISADLDDVRSCLVGFQKEFNRFVEDPAYRTMRMVDRRSFASVLAQLSELLADKSLKTRSVEVTVEGLSKFLDSLSLMNQRELLVIHDRDAVQDAQLQLARLRQAVAEDDLAAARTSWQRALQRANPLGGRDGRIDGVLLACTKLDPAGLDGDALLTMSNLLAGCL